MRLSIDCCEHRFVLRAAAGVRGDGELEEPRGGAGGHVVAAGGVHRRRQGEGVRRPAAVHAARLRVGLVHRRHVGYSWIPQAEDPDGFHVAVSNHRVHGWHGGRDRAAAAQGLPRHDALHHQEVSTFVSAFVVGAVALIAAAFAIPPATSGTPLPSARSVTAAIDGERRRRPARREIAGGEVGPAAAARTRKWRRSASTGREARRSVERGEKRARERGGEREDDDVATLTCGAHVGLTLTQLTRRIKPGSKPPKNLN
uniref:cDNA clone:002-147-B11, full insert sequence n=3 Tax=Oryza sativa subsp. japonica TaxID=39947 RepID=Q75GN3_ORYSJ|nr:unknown protein [Oryza sativa Japonica Group]BAG98896.1 unnamed protein product [Oryza sativa Japonica Group]